LNPKHPIKQLLIDTRAYWDHPGTPPHVRETFQKILDCGTSALGAEIFASETESKLVFHTCKSRFCTSCGQRATEEWQEQWEAVLPDVPFVGITFTMPAEFRPLLQQNPDILHAIPALGAEVVQQWAWTHHRARVIGVVVQQTFGGFLNFSPHLHVMVSAGGFKLSSSQWIFRLKYDQPQLMLAWRYAVCAFLSRAHKMGRLTCSLSPDEFRELLLDKFRYKWNVFISRASAKAHRLKHDGRYIRRPPFAQHRLKFVGENEVEYLVKDTRNKQFVLKRYTKEEFVDIMIQHVPAPRRHAVRFFGLLAPRCKAKNWTALLLVLGEDSRVRPARLPWRWRLLKTFMRDPLLDSQGQVMRWSGHRRALAAASDENAVALGVQGGTK
jgi:Putative transposase/Transposase zinc-binding domain